MTEQEANSILGRMVTEAQEKKQRLALIHDEAKTIAITLEYFAHALRDRNLDFSQLETPANFGKLTQLVEEGKAVQARLEELRHSLKKNFQVEL